MPIFRSLDLERMLIYQILFFLWKSAIFHSINLPFDEQAAEKILMLSSAYLFQPITSQVWNLKYRAVL